MCAVRRANDTDVHTGQRCRRLLRSFQSCGDRDQEFSARIFKLMLDLTRGVGWIKSCNRPTGPSDRMKDDAIVWRVWRHEGHGLALDMSRLGEPTRKAFDLIHKLCGCELAFIDAIYQHDVIQATCKPDKNALGHA